MKTSRIIAVILSIFVVFVTAPVFSMSPNTQERFQHIMDMRLEELGKASAALMKTKYPDVDWRAFKLPKYVFEDQATEMSYKVAVMEPALLGVVNVHEENKVIPCYCTCEEFGHQNLLYCFYKDGEIVNGFDEHGAQCPICIRQALLAFLWNDLGATHAEIMVGMKEKFAPLIEKYHQHEH